MLLKVNLKENLVVGYLKFLFYRGVWRNRDRKISI